MLSNQHDIRLAQFERVGNRTTHSKFDLIAAMSVSTPNSSNPSRIATPNPAQSRFTAQVATAEDLLKSQTVGLVRLDDFRKRRADALEQKELGRFTNARSDAGAATPGNVSDG